MGCWNESCMLTHLPIFSGEDVYAFLLLEHPFETNYCYASGAYVPIAVVRGKYNDYGGLETIEQKDRIQPIIQFFLRNNGFLGMDNMDECDFLNLFSLNCSLEKTKWHASQRFAAKTARVLIKAKALDQMLDIYRSDLVRHTYIQDELEKAQNLMQVIFSTTAVRDDITTLQKALDRSQLRLTLHNLMNYQNGVVAGCDWIVYAEAFMQYKTEDLFIPYLLLLLETTSMLHYLRMAWHIPSGSGSQDGYDPLFDHFLDVYQDALMNVKFHKEDL